MFNLMRANYNNLLEERKNIEKRTTRKLFRKNVKLYSLQRGHNARILALSPYVLDNNSSTVTDFETRYKYNHISGKLHTFNDVRAEIEEKIYQILSYKPVQFVHLLYTEDFATYKSTMQYCNDNNIAMIKKSDYNKMKKLINKWKLSSSSLHYKLKKQEKRKIIKIFKKTIDK
jgi:hypothetical protein